MRIIPAIDIIDGKCVRLTQGDYKRKRVYSDNPVEMAKKFEDHGIRYLHLVDLDGAKSNHIVNIDVLRGITKATRLIVDFGGGVKSDEDIKKAFSAGASMITGGSIAVNDPETFTKWLRTYGSEKVILGADVRDRNISLSGWMETSGQDIISFLQYYRKSDVRYVICTDISRDGVLNGPAVELYREIKNQFPDLRLIASGGIGSMKDVDALADLDLWGAIIGKAIYENRIQLNDLKNYIN